MRGNTSPPEVHHLVCRGFLDGAHAFGPTFLHPRSPPLRVRGALDGAHGSFWSRKKANARYVDGPYPALCLEETSCSVRGALLTPSRSGALMAAKLAEADKIEGGAEPTEKTGTRTVVHVSALFS